MLTLHSTPPDVPLFVGRLAIERRAPYKRPTLVLSVWSPSEHDYRSFTVPDAFPPDGTIEIDLPDDLAPGGLRRVVAGVDPRMVQEARAVIRSHGERIRAWWRERELAGSLEWADAPRYIVPSRGSWEASEAGLGVCG